MILKIQKDKFLHKSSIGVAIASFIIMTPFAINNFFQDRIILGVGSLLIIFITGFNAWRIAFFGKYQFWPILILIPAIIYFLVLALHQLGIIGILWCYPALIAFYFMLPERIAWIANLVLMLVIFPIALTLFDQPLAIRIVATMTTTSVFSAVFIRVITTQQSQLHIAAITDSLTGLLNRVTLEKTLEQSVEQYKRTGMEMTLLTLDIDHFKKINDVHGHDVGDLVLMEMSKVLKNRCRKLDRIYRLGGEEFLILLYGSDKDNSLRIAEELGQAISALKIIPDVKITVSIGLANLQAGEDWKAWVKRSDENLYIAKQEGRNRITT